MLRSENAYSEKGHGPTGTRDWQVRPYHEGDLEGLLALYAEVFGKPRSEADLRWKLLRPAGLSTLWVAATGSRIVGQHAGVPVRVKLGSTIVDAMHAVEAMTSSEYRKQGMLTELGDAIYSSWFAAGVPFIIGLPHPGWGSRAAALGYRPAFPLRWLSRPLRPVCILGEKLGVQRRTGSRGAAKDVGVSSDAPTGLLISPVREASSDFDHLWESAGAGWSNAVVRDAEWVNWRYLSAPDALYTVLRASDRLEPLGYIAYRTVALGGRRIGRVADLFTARQDRRTVGALMRAAVTDLKARGADAAVMLAPPRSELYATARRHGFILPRGEYKVHFITPEGSSIFGQLADPSQWLLSGGDFDVI